MNAQRTLLLQRAIDDEQRKMEEIMQVMRAQPCADANETASCYESTRAGILIMQHVQKRLLHFKRGMEAIEHTTHACCVDCGEEISPRRLAAVPDTMRCASCQADLETGQTHLRTREDAPGYLSYFA